jgi:hypothetical protein
MRPVFHGHRISLPKGTTTPQAIRGLEHMIGSYRVGDLVFEEVWHGRSGGVDPNEGGLTRSELQAILTGDANKVRGIKVHRFLWRVVERRHGKRLRHNGTNWTAPATMVLSRCDRPGSKHTMTADEVGIRFGRPHRGWPMAFAARIGVDGVPLKSKEAVDVVKGLALMLHGDGVTFKVHKHGTDDTSKWTVTKYARRGGRVQSQMVRHPRHLRTDNGPEFKNGLLTTILNKFTHPRRAGGAQGPTTQLVSLPATPQSNGRVERFNGLQARRSAHHQVR